MAAEHLQAFIDLMSYGGLYHLNCCKTVKEKGRTYYEVYSYAHSTREAKRTSARLLDKVVGEA